MKRNRSNSSPWWLRLWHLVVPPIPDFYGMLEAQTDNLRATLAVLSDYLRDADKVPASRVHQLVDAGHALRDRTLYQLYRSFITPIDREDIYTLAMTIDHVLDYMKNTVREVEVLQIQPDEWMQRMTAELSSGSASLAQGLARFRAGRAEEVALTVHTRAAERRVEDIYREALENMFQGKDYRELTDETKPPLISACLDFVITSIKHREVYRHLSNAADRLAHAGEALRDISIKYDTGGTGSKRNNK
ncbi:MAG: DUF47 family protein [Chromatiales bacterium]|jgi:uncharacterized protein Yka (UPF0111/DUF47 family)